MSRRNGPVLSVFKTHVRFLVFPRMSRKKNPQAGLDLFLDIVCNTFGGILFIAMLVVIMTKMIVRQDVPREIETVPVDAVLSAENRLQTLLYEQERLYKQVRSYREIVSPEQESARRVFELENERDEILKTKTTQSQTIIENVKSIAEAENLWNETLQQLELLEDDYHRKRQAFFESVVKDNLHDVQLPQMRASNKRKVALVVMGDKLFFWHRTTPDGLPYGLNDEQFVAFDRGDYAETFPKPWTGFPLTAEPDDQTAIAGRLRKFDASRVAFDVVVFRDSFGSFHILRSVMADNGYEYTLFPMKPDQSLIDRGGSAKPVQ